MLPLALAAAWLTLAQSSSLAAVPQRAYVVTSKAATAQFTPYLRPAVARRVRAVEFTRRSVVAAFVRTPTPCHDVEIDGWSRVRGTLTVSVAVHVPAAGTMCAQVIAYGYHVLSVPKLAAPAGVRLHVER